MLVVVLFYVVVVIADRRALASEVRPIIVVYSRFCNICIYTYIYMSLSVRTLCKDERTLRKLLQH